jgi:hypothetical protein
MSEHASAFEALDPFLSNGVGRRPVRDSGEHLTPAPDASAGATVQKTLREGQGGRP